MQISSSTSSIQMLKAQQAWEARRARQSNPQPTAESVPSAPQMAPKGLANSDVAVAEASSNLTGTWGQTVREVQSIAQKAGFIGVTEQDIRRAYTMGESLLADYRV